MSITSILATIISLLAPPPPGESIKVTINTHNNVGHVAEQSIGSPLHRKPSLHKTEESSSSGFLLGTIVFSYVGILAYITYLYHQLHDYTSWSLWRYDIDLNKLTQEERTVFKKTVCARIENLYGPLSSDTIKKCYDTIEREEKKINQYQTAANIVESLHISWMIPINKNLYNDLSRRLSRLEEIKKIVKNLQLPERNESP